MAGYSSDGSAKAWFKGYMKTKTGRVTDTSCKDLRTVMERTHILVLINLMTALTTKDSQTILHVAAIRGDWRLFKTILHLPGSGAVSILPMQDKLGRTALHNVVKTKDFRSVLKVLSTISSAPDISTTYFKIQDHVGYSPLHLVAIDCRNGVSSWTRCVDVFKSVLQTMESVEQLKLLQLKDKEGKTALDHAAMAGHSEDAAKFLYEQFPNQTYSKMCLFPDIGKSLKCRATSNLRMALVVAAMKKTTDREEHRKLCDVISWFENLSIEQLKVMNSHSMKYIVPRRRFHTSKKCYSLILHCAENRQYAENEANSLQAGLTKAGSEVIKCRWSRGPELQQTIDSKLQGILDDCALLVVCVMSHGSAGVLRDRDGLKVPLNNILGQLAATIPEWLPMVMLVQACQVDNQQTSNPPSTKDVTLKRPNTVLLMATVFGKSAIRGLYTGAMAKQFAKADGFKTIHSMHENAVKEIQPDVVHVGQIPIYQDTLDGKELALPG